MLCILPLSPVSLSYSTRWLFTWPWELPRHTHQMYNFGLSSLNFASWVPRRLLSWSACSDGSLATWCSYQSPFCSATFMAGSSCILSSHFEWYVTAHKLTWHCWLCWIRLPGVVDQMVMRMTIIVWLHGLVAAKALPCHRAIILDSFDTMMKNDLSPQEVFRTRRRKKVDRPFIVSSRMTRWITPRTMMKISLEEVLHLTTSANDMTRSLLSTLFRCNYVEGGLCRMLVQR